MSGTHRVSATNVTEGPRVFNSTPPIIIPRGGATDGLVNISDAELASMRASGSFDITGGPEGAEPGPLDLSVDDLAAHLATMDDADEVQKLIDAETAGKSRKGALVALEARRDELLA